MMFNYFDRKVLIIKGGLSKKNFYWVLETKKTRLKAQA